MRIAKVTPGKTPMVFRIKGQAVAKPEIRLARPLGKNPALWSKNPMVSGYTFENLKTAEKMLERLQEARPKYYKLSIVEEPLDARNYKRTSMSKIPTGLDSFFQDMEETLWAMYKVLTRKGKKRGRKTNEERTAIYLDPFFTHFE